jgi:ElaB/YqjD/DUF883 family membrane-anchored ribosome-binding protein
MNYDPDTSNSYEPGKNPGIKSDINNSVQHAKESAREIAHEAKVRAKGYVDTAGDKIHVAGDRLAVRVQDKPLQSSMIALGVGFVLALLLRK